MKASVSFSVCVYCGSRHGTQEAYARAARHMGRAIGERGWRLVYGGGNVGLMGVVADATLAAGGQVVGVIPELLLQKEVGHSALSELHVVRTMHERKQLMAEKAQAFVALPGGIGTLEELFEIWTWRHIGYHDRPIGLLNTQGYYDPLMKFLQRGCDDGFMDADQMDMLAVNEDPRSLLNELAERSKRSLGPDDYRQV